MKAKTNKKLTIKKVINRASHSLMVTVVPHKKNGYRPHLIRHYGLVAIFFVVIGLQLGYNLAATGSVLGHGSSITVSELLQETNKIRIDQGVPPLGLSDKLSQAAYLKGQDMIKKQYWAHDSPDGVQPWRWFSDVGYNYDFAGENLAKNFASSQAVVVAWMSSPEHKANVIKNEYSDVGFAIVNGEIDQKPVTIVVALYGRAVEATINNSQTIFSSAGADGKINILSQFGIAFQSITPTTSLGLMILAVAIGSSILAHKKRHNLAVKLKKSWYKHHGLYKSVGLAVFGLVLIFVYGGGQI